jgi:SanA protein
MKRKVKKVLMVCFCLIIAMGVVGLTINKHVQYIGSKSIVEPDEVPPADAILILGAYVFPDGTVSTMLRDRLNTGYELYEMGKAPKIIVSGDHGQKSYDEVNAMKKYLMNKKVPSADIFMDHAGFSTYESIYRARDIFEVKKLIIVTQEYHLMRAVFIAKELGLEAYGVAADKRNYRGMPIYTFREVAARNKDFLMVKVLQQKPKYLGEPIPVTGDGRVTDD